MPPICAPAEAGHETDERTRRASPYRRTNPAQIKYPRQAGVLYLAGPTGFEPAISSVTGRRVRPATPRARIVIRQMRSYQEQRQKAILRMFAYYLILY